MEIKILFGSETGNAESAANDIADSLKSEGLESEVIDMMSSSVEDLKNMDIVIIATSTWGDGDTPNNAYDLLDGLRNETDTSFLAGVRYAVFGLGDSMYPNFCQAGVDFDSNLERLGATRLLELRKNEDDFSENVAPWVEELISKVK